MMDESHDPLRTSTRHGNGLSLRHALPHPLDLRQHGYRGLHFLPLSYLPSMLPVNSGTALNARDVLKNFLLLEVEAERDNCCEPESTNDDRDAVEVALNDARSAVV